MAELASIIHQSMTPIAMPGAASGAGPGGAAQPGVPAQYTISTFNGETQQHVNWCWAAASVSINEHYRTINQAGSSRRQCEIVDSQYPGNNCCTNGSSEACIRQGRLDVALTFVGHFGGPAPSPIAFADIQREISGRHPIGVRVLTLQGTEHFVVIYGYGDNYSLLVWDPQGQNVQTNTHDWVRDIGGWQETYYTR